MGQTHIVSGLVTKRAEIDGQIISKLAEIKDLKQILHHIDRTIKVFSPEFDLPLPEDDEKWLPILFEGNECGGYLTIVKQCLGME